MRLLSLVKRRLVLSGPSSSAAAYPIVAALVAAESFLADRTWRPVSDAQERFLAELFASGRAEVARIPEIETLASHDAGELNDFLQARGFPAVFVPFAERRFGTASVLDVLVEWLHEGFPTELTTEEGRRFPAVRLPADVVRFVRARGHGNPIARLETKSGDTVCMTMVDDPPSGLDLLSRALELSRAGKENHDFDGLVFPMVTLEEEIGLGWLLGLTAGDEDGLPWEIEAAVQRNRLRMNETGARAESAVMVQVVAFGVRTRVKPDHVIDRPFLVWFERDGLEHPLFAAFAAEDAWRNPGAIA